VVVLLGMKKLLTAKCFGGSLKPRGERMKEKGGQQEELHTLAGESYTLN